MGGTEENVCGKCNKEIEGKAMKAKDVLYHEDGCFVCVTCNTDLKSASVYSKEGHLYCENDYKTAFVPKCAKCLEYILEVREGGNSYFNTVLTALKCKLSGPCTVFIV